MNRTLPVMAALLASLVAAAGCSSRPAYRNVFATPPASVREFPASFDTVWDAVSRTMRTFQFGIEDAQRQPSPEASMIQGTRYFTKGRRSMALTLQASVQPRGTEETAVYLNAVQRTDRVYTQSHRRFFLWIIPLPGGAGVEANRVREGEATIEDRHFYESFFEAVQQDIQAAAGDAPASGKAAAPETLPAEETTDDDPAFEAVPANDAPAP